MLRKKILWILLCLCFLTTQTAWAASSGRAEYKVQYFHTEVVQEEESGAEVFRIEIGLNKPSESFVVHLNEFEERQLVIDLDRTRLTKVKKTERFDGKFADKIDFVKVDKENSRAVITLPESVRRTPYKVYTLPKDRKAKKPFRIVVEIAAPDTFSFTAGLSGKRILLDAGHGGSDSGAVGPSGVKEKNVTFAVTNKIERILQRAGATVIMTRASDRDVYGRNATDRQELQARVNVGRKSGADVFVSIHANSFTSPSAHGTATYYYRKTQDDARLAQALQNGMVEYGGRYDRGIHEANFYVVKRSAMPAALVELAFVSNYQEEALLDSDAFQEALAQGICKGLSEFFTRAER